MAESLVRGTSTYEGVMSFVIKAHGRLPVSSADYSLTPASRDWPDEVNLTHVVEDDMDSDDQLKVFTYSDPGGSVCVTPDTVNDICTGEQGNMRISEIPARYAYETREVRHKNILDQPSPIRVFKSGSLRSRMPDYVLTALTTAETGATGGLPGGVYLCQTKQLLRPFSQPGAQSTLSEMIRTVIVPFALLNGASTVNVHLLACLGTGGVGQGSAPSGDPQRVAQLQSMYATQQHLLARTGHDIPAESAWAQHGGRRSRKSKKKKNKSKKRKNKSKSKNRRHSKAETK